MTALCQLLLCVAGPALFLSIDPGQGGGASASNLAASATAHLSARGGDEVELGLYALPADPTLLLDSTRGQTPPGPPPVHSPKAVATLIGARRALLTSVDLLHRGLSPEGRSLFKGWLGAGPPLAERLPVVAPALVEGRGQLMQGWRVDTPDPGWNYLDIDLGPLRPGLYALVASAGRVSARVVFARGALTALCVHGAGALTVLAQDADRGSPRGGVDVYAVHAAGVVPLGKTGADGLFTLRLAQAPWPISELILRQGQELAPVAVPASLHPGVGGGVGALLLDRRSARPGESVHLWALWRSLLSPDGRLALPDSAQAEIELRDFEGRLLLHQAAVLSALGTVTADLELPAGLLPGAYSVALAIGEERRSAGLEVTEPGPLPLTLSCERAEGLARCEARDGLGRSEEGVAVHWSLERPADGPSEVVGEGAAISGARGEVEIAIPSRVGEGWLRARAIDGLGREATTALRLSPAALNRLVFRPERRLVRPGHVATLSLEAPVGEAPLRGRIHVVGNAVGLASATGASGDSQSSALLDRWLETDPHGRATLSLTASAPGYIELAATSEAGDVAHATLFVTDQGGDIPATPDRLTLVPEVGERHRGEEVRLLVLSPFESGTALLAFEPPGVSPQAVPIRGYSGVARVVLPGSAGPLSAIAITLRGGRLATDRLALLRPARTLPIAVRLAIERAPHAGARPLATLELADERGRALAGQAVLLTAAGPPGADDGLSALPDLIDLIEPPQATLGIGKSASVLDSLPPESTAEPQELTPYGPAGVQSPDPSATLGLAQVTVPESGHASLPLPGGGFALAVGVAGPEEIGQLKQRLPLAASVHPRLSVPAGVRPGDRVEVAAALADEGCAAQLTVDGHALTSTCDVDRGLRVGVLEGGGAGGRELALERGGHGLEHRAIRSWAPTAERPGLAETLAARLSLPPANGPSADLACAAIRALGAAGAGRAQVRAPLARLAQLENLAGGFGDPAGELRRDLAALRGLRALGAIGDEALLTRTRARIGQLMEELAEEDPARAQATLAVASGGADASERPEQVDQASPERLALWLSKGGLRRADRVAASARLQRLLPTADALGLGELAVGAASLRVSGRAVEGAEVSRELVRWVPSRWTRAAVEASDDLADPARVPLGGSAAVGDEVEVRLTVPVEGRGTFCLVDRPAAGLALEGAAASVSPSGLLLLCGEPSAGRLSVSYRGQVALRGRFGMPAPTLGIAESSAAPELLEVDR